MIGKVKYENVLKNAENGKVVTRFPPEPSGYMHIGHVKAAMLNYHYSKVYNGEMILRFDDTNPSKEKEEFVDNILEDIKRLEITPTKITRTSDHFDALLKQMTVLIEKGICYCDDTPVDEMRDMRLKKLPSKYRDTDPVENLRIWNEMLNNNTEYKNFVVRGKIRYDDNNGCLRDPVFYRFNDEPHHVTGDKYKLYPTYDYACPIVDHYEGVTHALRSIEYTDRNPMYEWVLHVCGFPNIEINVFSRLNMVNTILSKRYLRWFVDNGLVEGWNDPRFPTVQGILRRGIQVETLKNFMLKIGPNKKDTTMDWDAFWADNKKVMDEKAGRLFAVSEEDALLVEIEGFDYEEGEERVHPKKEELGMRKIIRTNRVLVEKTEFTQAEVGEKVTLMKFGNVIVTEKTDSFVKVKAALDDINYSGTKKFHWVPADAKFTVKVQLVEFGNLITKSEMGESDKIEDIANKNNRFVTLATAELPVLQLKRYDVVQFERRGYYMLDCDIEEGQPIILNYIPDGKTTTMSKLEGKVDLVEINKGKKTDKVEKQKASEETEQKKKERKEKNKAKKAEKKEEAPLKSTEQAEQ